MQNDLHRPVSEPAATLFDALIEEMSQRMQRDPEKWKPLEMKRVLSVACEYSSTIDGPFISIEDIKLAEASACGHSDYAAKFSRQVATIITRNEIANT